MDTDSPVLMEGIAKAFPQVRVLLRPEHLTADTVPMNEILMYDTAQLEADAYLQTHSTNPLLRASTVSSAVRTFVDNYPAYDSLFRSRACKPVYGMVLARPVNHNPAILLRTQDYPRFMRKIPVCTCSSAPRWNCAAIASVSGRICSKSIRRKPGY